MANFFFEVEVTGVIDAWELALALKDRFNGPYANAPIHIERIAEPTFCHHVEECYCEESASDD